MVYQSKVFKCNDVCLLKNFIDYWLISIYKQTLIKFAREHFSPYYLWDNIGRVKDSRNIFSLGEQGCNKNIYNQGKWRNVNWYLIRWVLKLMIFEMKDYTDEFSCYLHDWYLNFLTKFDKQFPLRVREIMKVFLRNN